MAEHLKKLDELLERERAYLRQSEQDMPMPDTTLQTFDSGNKNITIASADQTTISVDDKEELAHNPPDHIKHSEQTAYFERK